MPVSTIVIVAGSWILLLALVIAYYVRVRYPDDVREGTQSSPRRPRHGGRGRAGTGSRSSR